MDKKSLEDIFNDDEFGLLNVKPKSSNVKTDEDRLIESFEEINSFVDNNGREPSASTMTEYTLSARLKNFRENEANKKILKPYDRHNLLGNVSLEKCGIDDILQDDDLGLLSLDNELDIFKFKHTPKQQNRAKTNFVAKRTPIPEAEFLKYEKMFQQVHKELKRGIRKFEQFKEVEKHLKENRFYLLDGMLLYLEHVESQREDLNKLGKNTKRRRDGRTKVIFENATKSNMLYRSLGKLLYANGKRITESQELNKTSLFVDNNSLNEEDLVTGWIYIIKSKSKDKEIKNIKDLYKIGFSTVPVEDRIKNASKEATYLYAEVEIIQKYKCININIKKLENLLHRFFAKVCLNIDLYDDKNQRITPREWFIVPLNVIEEAIELLFNKNILEYEYDEINQVIRLKNKDL